jgi:hypothetical protein
MCDHNDVQRPTYETIDELVERLRLPNRRWLTDRLRPGHPDRLPHHRFLTSVFSEADAAAIEARYARNQVGAVAPSSEPAAFEFDPVLIERGRRILARAQSSSGIAE